MVLETRNYSTKLESDLHLFPQGNEPRLRWLANILNAIHDGVVVVDVSSTILFANPAYSRTMGVPVDRVLGRRLADLEPTSCILEVLRSGQPLVDDPTHIQSAGVDIVTSVTPIFENGQLQGAVAIFRDVSELLALQSKLAQALEEMERTRDLSSRYFLELQELRARLLDTGDVVYESPAMRRVLEMSLRLARVDSNVLISGESGVGKEVVAKLIHRASERADGPFVVVNCGAIPENLLETELLGYEAGAFTGASKTGKPGLLELAHRGTLILDEVAELPLHMQVKLLRVIQEKRFLRVGGTMPVEVDVRFLAATNRDLKTMVRERRFREDLYYRLNVVSLSIPPLRERRADIIPLASLFLERFNRRYNRQQRLLPEVLRLLESLHWPGNVRELENLVERLAVSARTELIGLREEALVEYLAENPDKGAVVVTRLMPLKQARQELERALIEKALAACGSSRRAAEALGVDHSTVLRQARRHGLLPEQ